MNLSQKTFKFKDVRVGDYFMYEGRNYQKIHMPIRMTFGTTDFALDVDTGNITDKIWAETDCTESMLQR